MLCREGPLAMPGHSRLLLASGSANSPVEDLNLRPLLLLVRVAGEAPGEGRQDDLSGAVR